MDTLVRHTQVPGYNPWDPKNGPPAGRRPSPPVYDDWAGRSGDWRGGGRDDWDVGTIVAPQRGGFYGTLPNGVSWSSYGPGVANRGRAPIRVPAGYRPPSAQPAKPSGPSPEVQRMMEQLARMQEQFSRAMAHRASTHQPDYDAIEFDDLAKVRAEAAQRAADEANKMVAQDESYAAISGLGYSVTEEQKRKLINKIFSDYWDSDKEGRFQRLAKKYDPDKGRFGWLYKVTFGDKLTTSKGVKATNAVKKPKTVLGAGEGDDSLMAPSLLGG